MSAFGAVVRALVVAEDWGNAGGVIYNMSETLTGHNWLAQALRAAVLALEIATLIDNKEDIFKARLILFRDQAERGRFEEATATWQLVDPMGRDWSRDAYRPGFAELLYADFQFWQGILQEDHLAKSERLAVEGKDRSFVRWSHRLRGDWRLEQGEWALAAASYQEAVRLARERGFPDADSETGLALARHHLRLLAGPLSPEELAEARQEAERLATLPSTAPRQLAQLWLALGDHERAKHHALEAYRWAWADGEPYVFRYELTKTTELLQQLGVPIPVLPSYDPAKDEPLPWEADVRAAIEKLRAEKEAAKKKQAE